MTNKTYDILKYVALIGLPVVATLLGTLGEIWGVENVTQIVATINALSVALGGLLQISSHQYKKGEN
ncbi:phage holin [Globicatella sulfidifaciens]